MTMPDNDSKRPADDLPVEVEALLRARVMDTDPAFERRFDEMRRRLARGRRDWRPLAWLSGAVATAAAAVVFVWTLAPEGRPPEPAARVAWFEYHELESLETALSAALPLVESENTAALLFMPFDEPIKQENPS